MLNIQNSHELSYNVGGNQSFEVYIITLFIILQYTEGEYCVEIKASWTIDRGQLSLQHTGYLMQEPNTYQQGYIGQMLAMLLYTIQQTDGLKWCETSRLDTVVDPTGNMVLLFVEDDPQQVRVVVFQLLFRSHDNLTSQAFGLDHQQDYERGITAKGGGDPSIEPVADWGENFLTVITEDNRITAG